MKTVVFVLTLIGAVGVVAGATGDSSLYAVIPHHATISRLIVTLFGGVALVAAYGCWKRKMFGWYSGAGVICMAILWGVFRAVYLALTLNIGWLGILLGGVGEAVKIGIFAWVLLRFWQKRRKEFKTPNQALLPTPMSVTPAADAPVAPATGVADL